MNNRYPYLPEGRTIEYVPADNEFMREAKRVRDLDSTELNQSTGAVVVLHGKIIGRAANQAALKNETLQKFHKNGWCLRRLLKVPSGQKYWLCPGCAKNKHHAEYGAVRDALSGGKSIEGADLYLYGHWWCCKPCWEAMMKARINHVYLVEGADGLFKR